MADRENGSPGGGDAAAGGATPRIAWDDSKMRTSYANVSNVSSTREEVVLVFGMNQAWQGAQAEVRIELSDRVVLSPYAAKRLMILLQNVIGQYEQRFGTLEVTAKPQRAGTA